MEEEKGESVKVLSTPSQFEQFFNTHIWKDIVREVVNWGKAYQIEQDGIVDDAATENPSTASVLMHLGDLNGRKKSVLYFLSLPQVLMDLAKEQQDDTRRERADRSEDG